MNKNGLSTVTKVGETRVRSENHGLPFTASGPRADERYEPRQQKQRTNNDNTELLPKNIQKDLLEERTMEEAKPNDYIVYVRVKLQGMLTEEAKPNDYIVYVLSLIHI